MLKPATGALAAVLLLAAHSASAGEHPKPPASDVAKLKDPSRAGQLEPGQTRLPDGSQEASRTEFLVVEERKGEDRSYLVMERKDLEALRKGGGVRAIAFKGEEDGGSETGEEDDEDGSSTDQPSYRVIARCPSRERAERKAAQCRELEERARERRAERKAEEEARRKALEEKRKAEEEAPPPPKKRKLF